MVATLATTGAIQGPGSVGLVDVDGAGATCNVGLDPLAGPRRLDGLSYAHRTENSVQD